MARKAEKSKKKIKFVAVAALPSAETARPYLFKRLANDQVSTSRRALLTLASLMFALPLALFQYTLLFIIIVTMNPIADLFAS